MTVEQLREQLAEYRGGSEIRLLIYGTQVTIDSTKNIRVNSPTGGFVNIIADNTR